MTPRFPGPSSRWWNPVTWEPSPARGYSYPAETIDEKIRQRDADYLSLVKLLHFPGGIRLMTPEDFRKHGREVVDWMPTTWSRLIIPGLSRVEPGDIRAQLPDSPPSRAKHLTRSWKSHRVILPETPLAVPQLLRILSGQHVAPPDPR
ncbi:MAG: hypothetical protein Ct9H300mP1_28900 [Planctomycetaceae bacterium]|nr:MAG: hypothetical protein Ct9H300mP1_28900 [Planctomycetaceae bacterium]